MNILGGNMLRAQEKSGNSSLVGNKSNLVENGNVAPLETLLLFGGLWFWMGGELYSVETGNE